MSCFLWPYNGSGWLKVGSTLDYKQGHFNPQQLHVMIWENCANKILIYSLQALVK